MQFFVLKRVKSGQTFRCKAGRLLTLLAVVCLSLPVQAITYNELYSVQVELDRSVSNPQRAAYDQALTQLLVRLTGDPASAVNSELLAQFPDASSLVSRYQNISRDRIEVTFDGDAVAARLRSLGAPVWSKDRPLTIMWVAIDDGRSQREILSAAAEPANRLAAMLARDSVASRVRSEIKAAAEARGIPLVFPLMDSEDLENVEFSDVWGGFHERLEEASRRYGAESVVIARWRAGNSDRTRWTWIIEGQQSDWQGGGRQSVNRIADNMAARYAFRGSDDLRRVQLSISGLASVSAFGEVERLLGGVTFIEQLVIHKVDADGLHYEVNMLGEVERLRRVLDASPNLERASTSSITSIPSGPPLSEQDMSSRFVNSSFGDLLRYRYIADDSSITAIESARF